jgi:hypothetical protein
MHSIWTEDAKYLESKRASSYSYNQRIGELDCPAHVMLPLQKRSKLQSSCDDGGMRNCSHVFLL